MGGVRERRTGREQQFLRHKDFQGLRLDFLAHGRRKMIPKLLTRFGRSGESVEVGVFKGAYSKQLMSRWANGGHHYLVDPYLHFPCASEALEEGRMVRTTRKPDKHCMYNQTTWDGYYRRTVASVLGDFPQRATFLRDLSTSAAPRFRNASLDAIYIDARHDLEGVREDLHAWWPKLCAGGLFGGHDYLEHGVDVAVREFLIETGLATSARLYVTSEHPPSWFLFRPCQ